MEKLEGERSRETTERIVASVRQLSTFTINDLSSLTLVSRTTTSKVVQTLEGQGIVVKDGKGPSTDEGGKKPKIYRFNPRARYALGLQMSSDRLYGLVTDLTLGTIAELSLPINLNIEVGELVDLLVTMVHELIASADLAGDSLLGLALGSHGVIDFERGVVVTSPHNPTWGSFFRLRDLIAERMPFNLPVFVDNAVRYRALAEKNLGCLGSVQNGIVLHTEEGVIAGLLLRGRVYRGSHNLLGSIGHMKINVNDRERCDCGGYGCFEMQIKPHRVLRSYGASEIQAAGTGSPLPEAAAALKEIFAAANKGDSQARAALDEATDWFALALHNLVLTWDPEIIVIQGTYAGAGPYFIETLRRKVAEVSLLNVQPLTAIEYSSLGENAAALGAASYVVAQLVG